MTATRRMGRKRPIAHGPRLRLARYLDAAAPPAPPPAVDYQTAARAALARVYLNDQLGDCVIAGMAHLVGLFTLNAGAPAILTDAQVLALYEAIGGYRPGDPSTDNGCDEATALAYWHDRGAPAGQHRIAGYVTIDPTDRRAVQTALWLFENVFFGIELPDAWTQVQGDGFVWDVGTPNPSNGHAVVGVGYNARGVQVSTWGMVGTLTWEALARNVGPASGGELYAVLSPDTLNTARQRSPSGLAWSDLVLDFNALGGHVAVPPAPAPTPPAPPGPAPVPQGPTKAQALAAVTAALNGLPWPR
jgi:hypothetical protein